jgi:hypothetical protein
MGEDARTAPEPPEAALKAKGEDARRDRRDEGSEFDDVIILWLLPPFPSLRFNSFSLPSRTTPTPSVGIVPSLFLCAPIALAVLLIPRGEESVDVPSLPFRVLIMKGLESPLRLFTSEWTIGLEILEEEAGEFLNGTAWTESVEDTCESVEVEDSPDVEWL